MTGTTVVVGAGLSGMAAAFRLQQAGQRVIVLEREAGPGGCARTERAGDYLVDTGCDLINGSFARYLALARELGLGGRIVRSSGAVDVLRNGTAYAIDRRHPVALARTPLLSARAKFTFATGTARLLPRLRGLNPYSLTGHTEADQSTAYDLCLRYFNREVTDQVIDPVLRVFAGTGARHASGLSVLAAFAVAARPMFAVRGGMSAVPAALAARLDVRYNAEVSAVQDAGGPEAGVTIRSGGGEVTAGTCVLAIPYHQAARIWPPLGQAGGDFGPALRDVPLISISLGYDAPSPSSAYAVLVPSSESADVLLVMFQQNKAPDRAPAGRTLVTVYTDALVTSRMLTRSDEDLTGWAAEFIETYYPSLRGRRDAALVTRWPHTGYWPTPGYWSGIAAMRSRLPRGNVHVTSTLFGSGGIERAVLGGERTARRILASGAAATAALATG